jgi:secernin
MMRILRDHGAEGGNPDWHPQRAPARTICMHAAGEDRRGQTVGSLACELAPARAVHWVTGTAAPCISIFKPVLLGVPLPPQGTRPTGCFDARAQWWRHERLHRTMLDGFGTFLAVIREERDALEAGFRTRIRSVLVGGTEQEQAQVVTACWEEARDVEDRWLATIRTAIEPKEGSYWAAWEAMDELAEVPLSPR